MGLFLWISILITALFNKKNNFLVMKNDKIIILIEVYGIKAIFIVSFKKRFYGI